MKRSKSIRLVLIGSLSVAITSCTSGDPATAPISSNAVYTNNFFVPGVGYYHAPFRQFYPIAYNYLEPKSGKYHFGGIWGDAPFDSITNISSPSPEVASTAESQRTDIKRAVASSGTSRSGFGSSSYRHSTWS